MRKITIGLLIMALIFAIPGGTFAVDDEKIAAPSQTVFIMGGKEVSLNDAYDIEDNNYIQLRSVAQMLNGTKSQFNVYWDEVRKRAIIETGTAYTGVKPFEKEFYYPGEAVFLENTEITINTVFKSPRTSINDIYYGNTLYGVTFTVLTSNIPSNSQYWLASDFVKYGIAINGIIYNTFNELNLEESQFYPNQVSTVTAYLSIKGTRADDIASVVVADTKGNYKTIRFLAEDFYKKVIIPKSGNELQAITGKGNIVTNPR